MSSKHKNALNELHRLRKLGRFSPNELADLESDLARAYPATLTDELKDALGLMNFHSGPLARAFRDAGLADVPTKCEDEQAFILDKLVRHVILHGAGWRDSFSAEMDEVKAALRAKKDVQS